MPAEESQEHQPPNSSPPGGVFLFTGKVIETADKPDEHRLIDMSKITIFANGKISSNTVSLPVDSLVIAADGGARHCLKLGITPQVVIGDFDSLTDKEIETLSANGVEFIRHPVEKDETDLELALDQAFQMGATEVTLYGLLGGRWDMTVANLLLLAAPRYAEIKFRIIDGATTAFILRGGGILELDAQPGATVSAIPLNGAASGITYQGLQWPLENATLPFGTPRGVSNAVVGSEVQIFLEEGTLLVFVIDSGNR
jgi:thiamine pyrophosphokinase